MIDIKERSEMFAMANRKYILVVMYGDPNTHAPLKTSFGLFDSNEQAQEFSDNMYEGSNHICEIIPITELSDVFDTK